MRFRRSRAMRPALLRPHMLAMAILLAVAGVGAQSHQTKFREFFGISYKHPETPELTAARDKAYDDLIWIMGMMSGTIIFIFMIAIYGLVATTDNIAAQQLKEAGSKADVVLKMERLHSTGQLHQNRWNVAVNKAGVVEAKQRAEETERLSRGDSKGAVFEQEH
jgi:hypothetical protein